MKPKIILLTLLLSAGLLSSAQTFNMSYQGSDTTTLCNGTLYDHGGATGSYSNYANGYFYLDIPGSSLNITFTAFQLESCCDYVRIYDGIGTSGTLLLSANGWSIPNSGNPINVPSGKATIRFSSDGSATYPGFALNWSGGGSTSPSASFSVGNSNPPVNFPVSFTNTSTNGGSYLWDFGDGNSSTDANPEHSYTSPGIYSVTLTASNCHGSDVSTAQTVTVMDAPVFAVTPDSLYSSVSCGNNASSSFTINHNSGGTMVYDLVGRDLSADPYDLTENFESGLGSFSRSPSAYIGFNGNVVLGNAAVGNGALMINGNTSYLNGYKASFSPAQPTEFSYYIKSTQSSYHGDVILGNDPSNTNEILFYARAYYGILRVYTGSSIYNYGINPDQWNHIEVKNIDWVSKTYDIYINDILVDSGRSFNSSSISSVNEVHLWNSYNTTCYFDNIEVGGQSLSPLSFSQQSGVLSTTNSNTISVTAATSGNYAGRYLYEVVVNNNSTGPDSNFTIPYVVDVTGSAGVNLDKSCVNFGSIYSTMSATDSVMVYNSGCDTLDISSITSTNADISANASDLLVAPFDTAYLHISLSPSGVGSYTDTIHLVNNDVDTIICISGNSLSAPVINTDSASYSITSVGCNDSIPLSFKIYNEGGTTLNWQINSGPAIFDDFESGLNSSIWSSLGTNNIITACQTNSGTQGLSMDGNGVRIAETQFFPVNTGDSISFWAFPGNSSGTGCENPDGSEDVSVQYSTDGTNWTTVGMIYNYNIAAQFYEYEIPVSGQVKFRFYQSYHSGINFDNYIIDDFSILNGGANASFSPSSGALAATDSVNVSGNLSVEGLISGTYNRTVTVTSDDPANPSFDVPVTITVQGEPNMVLSTSCIAFGSVITGNTQGDSTMIINNGCEDLTISGHTTTNSDLSFSTTVTSIPPGDTAYGHITFAPTSIGAANDTIYLNTNDTTGIICVNAIGQGAPNPSINPDSIHITHSGCNDTIEVSVNLSNLGGLGALDFLIEGANSSSSGSALEVVLFKTYSDISQEYANTFAALNTYLPGANYTESMATTPAGLAADIAGADVLIIPELENISSTISYGPVVQAFANAGKAVIVLYNGNSIHTGFGLTNFSFSTGPASVLSVPDPTHPVMVGTSGSIYSQNATRALSITSPGLEPIVTGFPTEIVVGVHPYGTGMVGYYGFDFYNSDSNTDIMLANLVEYVASGTSVDWIEVQPDSGVVAIDDSATIDVKLITTGLLSGTHQASLIIKTNDPANPEISLPVHLVLNGAPEISTINNSSCFSFSGVLQGATETDSLWVYNSGCDTLDITGYNAGSSEFSIDNLPQQIAPGDSMALSVAFHPATVGTFSDTIQVLNNDTTVFVCVNGVSAGAPVLSLPVDTLVVDLNKCHVITNEAFRMNNTGQGPMDYDIQFGGYTGVSHIPYSVNAATTTHTFNGVPLSDTLELKVIFHGDFGSYYQRPYLTIDGTYYYGSVYGNNLSYVNDTVIYQFYGTSVQNWTSDGTLTFDLANSSSVTGGTGSFHRVEIRLASQVNWVSIIGSSTGTIAQGNHANKNLLFNAASLSVGTYNTTMNIATNSPGSPNMAVPVELNVISEPSIRLSDTCLTYPMTLVGDTTSLDMWIYNDGCEPLNVSGMLSTNNAFKVSPSNGSIPVGDSLMVTVDFVPSSINNYSASILVNNNDTSKVICLNGISNSLPLADYNFGYEDACIGEVLFFNESDYETSVLWNFGDGTTSSQNDPVHFFQKPGSYRVLLRASNAAGFDTISKVINVNPLYVDFDFAPNDTVLPNTTIDFYDSSAVPVSWSWNFGDGNTSTSQNPTNTYANTGKYEISLEVTDARGCIRSETKNIWVVSGIGIEEHTVDGYAYSLYPNPSTGLVNLESGDIDWSKYEFIVFDATGKLVRSTKVSQTSGQVQLDISHVRPGMYKLVINRDGVMKSRESLIIH